MTMHRDVSVSVYFSFFFLPSFLSFILSNFQKFIVFIKKEIVLSVICSNKIYEIKCIIKSLAGSPILSAPGTDAPLRI